MGGEGLAVSRASGGGDVFSLAIAQGGGGGSSAVGGPARALATAEGTGGLARATASSSVDRFEMEYVPGGYTLERFSQVFSAEASAALGGVPRVDVGSRVLIAEGGSQGPFDTARDSAAFLLGAPPSSELEAALEDNPTAAARFIVDDLVVALALGLLSFSTPEASASQPTELEAAVDITLSPAEATLWRDAFVSFLDPEPLGPGMEAIRLLVTSGETTFLDQEFDLVDDAATFLDDRVVELDGLFTVDDEGESSLRIALTALGSAPMSKFGLDFLVGATPVPEPDSAWLGAVGLAGLLLVSRSRRPSH